MILLSSLTGTGQVQEGGRQEVEREGEQLTAGAVSGLHGYQLINNKCIKTISFFAFVGFKVFPVRLIKYGMCHDSHQI